MSVLGKGGALQAISSADIRPPHLYSLDETNHLILMEDVGNSPDLGKWLKEPHTQAEAQAIGNSLGQFIGTMHRVSAWQPALASVFDNHTIQRTRLEFHYGNIQTYAQRAGLADAPELGKRAVWLGEHLLQPGTCLIMGDLWPASIFVLETGLRVIDWELAHFGRPSQDVGHLAAHLWMYAHRLPDPQAAANARTMLEHFLGAYRAALGEEFSAIFGKNGVEESSTHFGSEIFARTVGVFQKDYLYDDLSYDHPAIQEAIQNAATHIRNPLEVHTFDPLGWRSEQKIL
jgi:5-methylthioribose kinase